VLGALAVACILAACGHDSSQAVVVARVGKNTISKAELERWTAIEAVISYEVEPTRPVPKGIVPTPPAYSDCIAYLAKLAQPEPGKPRLTTAALKQQCAAKHTQLQRHVEDILLTYYWLKGQAAQQDVKLTNIELEELFDRVAPTKKAMRRFLSLTGERMSDLRLIAEKDLFDTRLTQILEGQVKTSSQHRREKALIRAATTFTERWSRRTSCRQGYVVSECKQYRGVRMLIEP
jgi:hypothetical protein